MNKISVIINTLNEENNLKRALKSVSWANEVIVCDMYSQDKTVEIAKSEGAKIVFHQPSGYVEPARNFAISKSSNDWILILDADEEIPDSLAKYLEKIAEADDVKYVQIPRKNIIFDKWIKTSMWWPDYNIRFFKKGMVVWSDKIHSNPQTQGKEFTLPELEENAIIHHNYQTISQYIDRMNRYTTIQAKGLYTENKEFAWQDLIKKPTSEFLRRYFAAKGFEDGLHGLALCILQAVSEFVLYIKLWELYKFKEENIQLVKVQQLGKESYREINWWFKTSQLSKVPLKRAWQKLLDQIS